MQRAMTWPRQVWHVFAKDVQRQRWVLLMFVLCIGAAMFILLQDNWPTDPEMRAPLRDPRVANLLWLIQPVVAGLLCALVLIEDAPVSPRSHWSVLPFDRSAVVTAKVVFAMGLLPVIVLMAVLSLHYALHVPAPELPAATASGANSVFLLVTIAMPIAALARDLRTFIVAMLSLILLLTLVNFQSFVPIERFSAPARQMLTWLFPLVAVLTTWRAYRTRTRSWRMTGFVAALTLLNSVHAGFGYLEEPQSLAAQFPDARFSSELRRSAGDVPSGMELAWNIELDGIPTALAARLRVNNLQPASSALCSFTNEPRDSEIVLQYPDLLPQDSITWLGVRPDFKRAFDSTFARRWLPTSSASQCMPELRADLLLSAPRHIGSLPFRPGSTLVNDGYRVTMGDAYKVRPPFIAAIDVVSSIPSDWEGRASYQLTYVLVNAVRREAIALEAQRGGYGSAGPASRETMHLGLRSPQRGEYATWQSIGFSSNLEFETWLREAMIQVFTWDLRARVTADPVIVDEDA